MSRRAVTTGSSKVLMVTTEWPSAQRPSSGPFIAQQVRFLRDAGVEIEVFAFGEIRGPLRYLRGRRRVRALLRSGAYGLVHAQFGQSALLAVPSPVPLVVTFRGSDLEGIIGGDGSYTVIGRVLRKLSRVVARHADAVIVVSRSLAQRLPDDVPCSVIPSGVDLDLFRPGDRTQARRILGLPETGTLVMFAGDPEVPGKRVMLARRVIELLREGGSEVDLVTVRGVPRATIRTYLNACDALLLTSRHEGSPNSVKEALACDLPVVSVDVGDVRERIGRLRGCVVTDTDEPSRIADALRDVLSDREVFHGRAAVTDIDERVLTRTVLGVYERARASRPARDTVEAHDER